MGDEVFDGHAITLPFSFWDSREMEVEAVKIEGEEWLAVLLLRFWMYIMNGDPLYQFKIAVLLLRFLKGNRSYSYSRFNLWLAVLLLRFWEMRQYQKSHKYTTCLAVLLLRFIACGATLRVPPLPTSLPFSFWDSNYCVSYKRYVNLTELPFSFWDSVTPAGTEYYLGLINKLPFSFWDSKAVQHTRQNRGIRMIAVLLLRFLGEKRVRYMFLSGGLPFSFWDSCVFLHFWTGCVPLSLIAVLLLRFLPKAGSPVPQRISRLPFTFWDSYNPRYEMGQSLRNCRSPFEIHLRVILLFRSSNRW